MKNANFFRVGIKKSYEYIIERKKTTFPSFFPFPLLVR